MTALLGALAALLALDVCGVLGDGAAGRVLGDWLLWGAFAVAGVLSAVRARQVPAERLPWSLMAVAWTSYVAGGLVFNVSLDGSSAHFPSLPDLLWLAWYPCAIAAFATSRVQTPAARPYSPAFARSATSSSVS